ncbi:unnamed protein product [Trichobilharzia regenti]|nr:unnamed protein product [Trichobilharzia regenti]
MQLDEEIGKLTATVPPVVCKRIRGVVYPDFSTKYVIENEPRYAFLRSLVADVPELKPNSRKPSNSKSNIDSDAQSESSDASLSGVDEPHPRTLSSNTKKSTRQKRRQSPCSRNVNKRMPSLDENPGSLAQGLGSSVDLMSASKASKVRRNGKSVSNSETSSVSFDSSSVRNEGLVDCRYTEA